MKLASPLSEIHKLGLYGDYDGKNLEDYFTRATHKMKQEFCGKDQKIGWFYQNIAKRIY